MEDFRNESYIYSFNYVPIHRTFFFRCNLIIRMYSLSYFIYFLAKWMHTYIHHTLMYVRANIGQGILLKPQPARCDSTSTYTLITHKLSFTNIPWHQMIYG